MRLKYECREFSRQITLVDGEFLFSSLIWWTSYPKPQPQTGYITDLRLLLSPGATYLGRQSRQFEEKKEKKKTCWQSKEEERGETANGDNERRWRKRRRGRDGIKHRGAAGEEKKKKRGGRGDTVSLLRAQSDLTQKRN